MAKEKLTGQQCHGMHRFLMLEDWDLLGGVCSCLICHRTFHLDQNIIEIHYTPFIHHSGTEGPDGDMELLVLSKAL